jgi:hypothetical protein
MIFVSKLYRLRHENKSLDVFPCTSEYVDLFDLEIGESLQTEALTVHPNIRHPAYLSNMTGGNDDPEANERERDIWQIAAEKHGCLDAGAQITLNKSGQWPTQGLSN